MSNINTPKQAWDCIIACYHYLAHKNESPRAATDLMDAAKLLEGESAAKDETIRQLQAQIDRMREAGVSIK